MNDQSTTPINDDKKDSGAEQTWGDYACEAAKAIFVKMPISLAAGSISFFTSAAAFKSSPFSGVQHFSDMSVCGNNFTHPDEPSAETNYLDTLCAITTLSFVTSVLAAEIVTLLTYKLTDKAVEACADAKSNCCKRSDGYEVVN